MNKKENRGFFGRIIHFFDKLEDHNRAVLSRHPIIYAIIGGFGIVQYWRGVWHLSDEWGIGSWTSIIIGLVVLLATGLLVSFFIGDNILLTGIRREKKLFEKTEEEIRMEESKVVQIQEHIDLIEKNLEEIKNHFEEVKSRN